MSGEFAEWRTLARFPFGDGPELADELLELILIGKKRATCWSAAEGVKNTVVGGHWVGDDGRDFAGHAGCTARPHPPR